MVKDGFRTIRFGIHPQKLATSWTILEHLGPGKSPLGSPAHLLVEHDLDIYIYISNISKYRYRFYIAQLDFHDFETTGRTHLEKNPPQDL